MHGKDQINKNVNVLYCIYELHVIACIIIWVTALLRLRPNLTIVK
jgi:hypothetical protein